MPSRDIRTTKERVDELRSIVEQINLVIRGCQDVQKYYDRLVREGWTQYEDIHLEVKSKMDTLDAALVQAWLELGRLSNGAYAAKADLTAAGCGMTFQYTWEAGKCNIGSFDFDSTTDNIEAKDHVGSLVPSIFGTGSGTNNLVPVGHFIKVEGATDADNNGIFQIDNDANPAGDDKMYVTGNLTTNTSDQNGKITYWATS